MYLIVGKQLSNKKVKQDTIYASLFTKTNSRWFKAPDIKQIYKCVRGKYRMLLKPWGSKGTPKWDPQSRNHQVHMTDFSHQTLKLLYNWGGS